jgi:hypothetical protein
MKRKNENEIINKKGSDGSKLKSSKKIYLDPIDLTKHTILSQGKGLITVELSDYWILMIENLSHKFLTIEYDFELVKDSKQDCYIHLVDNLYNYDYSKCNNAFPYWTEVIKRRFALSFKKWHRYSKQYGYEVIGYY